MSDESRSDAEQKELLRLLMERESDADFKSQEIPRLDRSKPLPLSFGQERIWFLENLHPGSQLFVFCGAAEIEGKLDITSLDRAFRHVIERHEILRSSVVLQDGEPMMRLADMAEIPPLAVDEFASMSDEERTRSAAAAREDIFRTPFDLTAPPLLRARLLNYSEDRSELLIAIHHIAIDDSSIDIFFRDLSHSYNAFREDREPELPALPIGYADFAAFQRAEADSREAIASLDYWRKRLAGAPSALDLPTDKPRPPVQDYAGAQHEFHLGAEMAASLRAVAKSHGVTLYTVLLAIFFVLLKRLTSQTDIIVGSPFANRALSETDDLLGLFINNVVLRADMAQAETFADLLKQLRQAHSEAMDNQGAPFEKLVEKLNPQRDQSRSPIFQSMFVFLSGAQSTFQLDGVEIRVHKAPTMSSEYDLSLFVRDRGSDLECWIEYATALFEADSISRLGAYFKTIARSIASAPAQRIADIELLPEEERLRVARAWNDTAETYPGAQTVHELFEAQAKQRPDAVAAAFADRTLTYGELDADANRLARRLKLAGLSGNAPVALYLDRTPEMLIAMLGVLKAGGAYLPIDASYPADRINYMLEDSGAELMVSMSTIGGDTDLKIANTINLDTEWNEIAGELAAPVNETVDPTDLVYVIYTSGSTGRPKGVQVEHRNVVNYVNTMTRALGMTQADAVLALATVSFDIHVLEIWAPFSIGARISVAARDEAMDGAALLDRIQRDKVTFVQATPSTWRLMIDGGWREQLNVNAVCTGEPWGNDLAADLLERCVRLWNGYGPTETTVHSGLIEITNAEELITIGFPVGNTELHVVDGNFRLQPLLAPGELVICGAGVTRGYLDRPELTAEKFVDADIDEAPKRYYRTGDLARRLPDGRIQMLGRLDHQVKIRGYRIELGEIESALRDIDAVEAALAVVREDAPGDKRLACYLIAGGTYRPATEELRAHLRARLPSYMTPQHYVWLDRYPTLPNGKINRAALPKPEAELAATVDSAPLEGLEKVIAKIFEDVLDTRPVGRYDNFFDLGGHSLLSLKVIDRFEKATGKKMQPGELFQQTVGQLANWHSDGAVSSAAPEAKRKTEDAKPKDGFLNRLRGIVRS